MPVDPFVVHIARLRRSTGTRWHEVRQAPFDPAGTLQPATEVESAVPLGADASCDAVLESFPGGVMVTATVCAPWAGVCRRCATPVGGRLEVAVRERFVYGPAAGGPAAREVPGDEEAYPIVDDQLDLGPMVHESLVLELPLTPLCHPDCRGLCPGCGVDRNHEACACVAPVDPRWAILSVLQSGSEPDRSVEQPRKAP
ncbi:MAG TPA: DUF177 domain-containing protein [Acidimicrobiales bacterium]|nr:DUF177 domain-containing protein [Acidimicrobiales bacterium]